jgi:hypothetical protein
MKIQIFKSSFYIQVGTKEGGGGTFKTLFSKGGLKDRPLWKTLWIRCCLRDDNNMKNVGLHIKYVQSPNVGEGRIFEIMMKTLLCTHPQYCLITFEIV